jgi:hypothetical protein
MPPTLCVRLANIFESIKLLNIARWVSDKARIRHYRPPLPGLLPFIGAQNDDLTGLTQPGK